MKNHQKPLKNQGFLWFLQISILYIFGTPEPSLGHYFASKLAPWTHFSDPKTPCGRPVGSQGASWEVLGVVSGRLFLPLSELWITLMHPWGSFDDTEHPFLSILGPLGAIFLHFGTHFGYFCMCKKVKRMTSTQQAEATKSNQIKGTCNKFSTKSWTQLTILTETTKQSHEH